MQVYGLVGNPVGHSRSPPMHEAAYDALGLDARYVTFEPAPDRLDTALRGADALGVAGLNVTIPFKRAVFDHVAPTETAAAVGAVNTIDFTDRRGDEGRPVGDNTDVAGVQRAFAHHDVAIEGRDAVVVGAGGAGRAAVYALADAGASVHVANRTVDRAESLVDDFAGTSGASVDLSAGGLATLETRVPDADLLVNATSVGMESDESPVPASLLHADLAVLDAVYAPLDTRLLREARDAGATTIDGAWMLLFQGVAAFERWTGESAPVDAMDEALRDGL